MKKTTLTEAVAPTSVPKETQLIQNKALAFDIIVERERLGNILQQITAKNEELTAEISEESPAQ